LLPRLAAYSISVLKLLVDIVASFGAVEVDE
jgi:hypothetical protein